MIIIKHNYHDHHEHHDHHPDDDDQCAGSEQYLPTPRSQSTWQSLKRYFSKHDTGNIDGGDMLPCPGQLPANQHRNPGLPDSLHPVLLPAPLPGILRHTQAEGDSPLRPQCRSLVRAMEVKIWSWQNNFSGMFEDLLLWQKRTTARLLLALNNHASAW